MPARHVPQHALGLISRELDGEFLVLQTATNEAHALSGPAYAVWRGAVDDLTDEEYATAVAELRGLGLLLDNEGGLSRRTMIKRAGIVAAGVGIASIALPMASAAASTTIMVGTITPDTVAGNVCTPVTINGSGFIIGHTYTISLTNGTNPGGTAGTVTATSATATSTTQLSSTFCASGYSAPGSSHKLFPLSVTVTDNSTSASGTSAAGAFNVQT